MMDARPVVLTLPSDVASRVEAIQQRDPELVAQMLRYCAMRETIFTTSRERSVARLTTSISSTSRIEYSEMSHERRAFDDEGPKSPRHC